MRDSKVSPDGRRLYLLTAERLLVLDTASGKVAASRALGQVNLGLDLSGDGSRIYLSNPLNDEGSAGSLQVLDAASLGDLGTVETPGLSLYTAAAIERD